MKLGASGGAQQVGKASLMDNLGMPPASSSEPTILLDFNIRLPYTNIYSKKFFPRPKYIMEVLAKTRNHHQARPSVVSSPRVGMSAAKRTKTPSNKIETKLTWKILQHEGITLHSLPMISPPRQHQELGPADIP